MSAEPSTFGKYFLTEKIATGGMAEIYLAKILGPGGFEKFLVIKKIHPELSGERQFVEMFVAEAKTLVSLTHGNIVPIYELGMVDSTYFIAMEYIDGPTLEQLLTSLRRSGESMSPAMTAYICAELLKGLDYAHRKGEGVIHRDLSPRNVMLSREGEVKLVDFGIAVAHVERASTQADKGNPAGSYPYMSPEQVRGDSLDGRSDLFATGILLWEMLTGKRLFAKRKDEDTLEAVLSEEIPKPSTFRREAEGVLDVVCSKALKRAPSDRYATAGELLVAINRFLYSQKESVTPQDVSRFIAKHCPPTTKEFARPRSRMGTQNDGGTMPFVAERNPRKRSGTVPMERPQGKRRAETVQSFATHVNLREVLSHVGDSAALYGVGVDDDAIGDVQAPRAEKESPDPVPPTPTAPAKSSLKLLPVAAVFVLLAGTAVFYLTQSRGADQLAALPPDAATKVALDAGAATPASDAAVSPPQEADAAPIKKDAATAAVRRRPDAQEKKAPGRIRIGANPWAEVFLNGKPIGRAPGSFEVPAGSHSLELRFQEQSKIMKIEVKSSELTSLGVVDFTSE
jgi:serine/threonine protein kinase